MISKLTLAMDDAVVKKAKKYAQERNLSLSKLVESFFGALAVKKDGESLSLSPITQDLAGMIKATGIKDKDVLADALMKKYL